MLGNRDLITCAFKLQAIILSVIRGCKAHLAFVLTNSISQGEQVSLLWPHLLKNGVEINFCHTSFKWENNAKGNAGVTCVIIGLSNSTS